MVVEERKFTDLLSKIIDNRGRSCPTAEGGIPLIATNCIRNDFLYPAYEKLRYISEETYKTWFRGHPEPGDIIFVCKGTPGRVCLAPDPVDFVIAQDMVAVRANQQEIYPKYLFAALRSEMIQSRIENMHVGTLIPHFKKGDFDKLFIPVPHRRLQETIGDTYFELSSKIELNRRMNETLEAMARAIFKSWFVDFDPVRAKAEGRQPDGMDAETAALFPSSFEESPLGPVPKGWRVGILGEVAENPRRGVQATAVDGTVPYIGLEHMPRKCIALSEWGHGEEVISNKSSFLKGEFLFGKLRPYFHKVGVAPVNGVCSTDILVVCSKDDNWYGFVLSHISSTDFVDHTDRCSAGTKMPRTNWGDMSRYQVVLPPSAVAASFSKVIEPMVEKIILNIHESRTLAALRDTLLPKLLSGRISIKCGEVT